MKRKTWYRLHKWIAVGSGVALLVWCASGIAIVLPHILPSISVLPSPQAVGPTPDYSSADISPASATEALRAAGRTEGVRDILLRKIGERVAYEVRFEGDTRALVDAQSGAVFTIDSTMAVELARMDSGSTAEVSGFRYVESPYNKYPFGEFPAYTVEFADAPALALSVAINTGEVMRSGTVSRARVFIENTHSFRQLDRFAPSSVTYWILVIFTVLTAIAALIGFWIAIPRSWLPVALGGVKAREKDTEQPLETS